MKNIKQLESDARKEVFFEGHAKLVRGMRRAFRDIERAKQITRMAKNYLDRAKIEVEIMKEELQKESADETLL